MKRAPKNQLAIALKKAQRLLSSLPALLSVSLLATLTIPFAMLLRASFKEMQRECDRIELH